MADSAKVRLVRCPKCENLLPELADYSVYQCGGCGAVLRAKAKRVEGEKPNEETIGLPNSSEKKAVDSGDASNSDAKMISGSVSRRDHVGFEFDKEGSTNNVVSRSGDEGVAENGLDSSAIRREKLPSLLGREPGDLKSDLGSRIDFRRSSRMSEDVGRSARAEVEGVRFSTSNYNDEGPSSYHLGAMKNYGIPDESRVRSLEQDRVLLLKKLDELRDQLSRSCEVSDSPKEKVSRDSRPYMQYARPDNQVVGSPNFSRFAEPVPYNNGYEIPTHGFSPSVPYPNHANGFGDPFGPQIHRGPPHHFPRPPPYFSGQYVDNNPDPFEPYSHNAAFHQPSCACFQCYEKHRRASAPVQPSFFSNKRFHETPSNPVFYRPENPGVVGPSDPNKSRQSHKRWPSDLAHDLVYARDHGRGRGRRLMYAGGQRCRPVSNGAPFLGCSNCFEVLKLPKKMRLVEDAQRKLKCGACLTIMELSVVDKKIAISVSPENVHSPVEVTNGSDDVAENGILYPQGPMNRSFAFSSDDYDNAGYDFQAMDREPISLQVGTGLTKSQEAQSFLSSSLCTSDDGNSPDLPVAKKEVTSSAQHPIKTNFSPPPPGSPLQEHFDFSTKNRLADRLGNGNQSSRSDQENLKPNKIASRQNSLNKVSLATEMEVSFNEFSNTGISQDSGDASRTEEPSRTNNKGGDSFFANIIKKSFKDFSRSNQVGERSKISVYVNGHPITDRVLKKAQKSAGVIHPGQYWYDYRAGFWGVMGGSCLGIVLPYIEELNYPMPENCSGGTTGVYVNGRELHQKDLDLLASRGLPSSRDRSYIIEISGRVLDEDTGEELDCLGKLAPTVEKAKHGFGMKPPKVVQPDQSS